MRRRTIVAGALLVGTVTLVGLGAPQVVRSPAQIAADRAAPVLPPATAEVERRVVEATVTLRGEVTTARRVEIEASASDGARAVVTAIDVGDGDRVRSGDVLVEISGRPVILLDGRLPAYRDLQVGATGPDVEQLQRALAALGYGSADANGRLGPSTKAAVRRLYTDRGYPAPRGAVLPASEVAFLSGLPGRVERVDAAVGQTPEGAVLVVASGRAIVTGSLAAGDRALVRVGQPAEITADELDLRARGRVVAIGELTATDGPSVHPLRIRPRGELDRRFSGREVRITLVSARSEGPVLVVPLSAITTRADATTVVSVLDDPADGTRTREVAVTLGVDADGYVAVEPVDGGLDAGDAVMVGVGQT
jgi:hypothetical protein